MANNLIPLPGFLLPRDFPWQVGFMYQVEDQIRRLRVVGHFLPPRYFGYYFDVQRPVGIGCNWTVSLDERRPITLLPALLDEMTKGKYKILSSYVNTYPEYILIHDRHDGTCFLWTFQEGLRFIQSVDPVVGDSGEEASAPNCQ